ncbi:zinc-binding dehydrogenase [Prochlorococcus marinus XMU1412]|uniref:zinc-binding dehydrogenase n=1 Tax=Prochlorococcus marinus TaxID=1219 RepID=UPI001ADAC2FE|nr:zinc-binding dehydrogenase [Prochlorococcus marinus]MBO8240512.1 zinc-binding dehydrogenase [Prochlorococcus marinus XMU1412]MBW3071746.1 dehydrogenase [Prochlorococcus marinus str. MU1412]
MIKLNDFTDAAILVKQNQELVVDKIKLPNSLEIGQVLVKVCTSGICGSQIGEITGAKGKDNYLPHLLGHEGAGIVLDIGPGVKTLAVGDQVVLHWRKGSGLQSETPKYTWRGKNLNAGWVTTFNRHAVVSENRCTVVPLGTDMELSSLFGCAITTGFGVVENNAKIFMGESVVVFGAGGIGLNIIQALSLSSAYPIIAVDLYDSKLKLAKNFGASHLINSRKTNFREEINKILNPNSLNVFIDNTGLKEIIEMGYEVLSAKGRLILVGVPRHNSDIKIHSLPMHFGKSIEGSHGGESIPNEDIPRYLKLFNNGIWNINGLVTERFKLEEINYAIKEMQEGNTAGRIIINL